MNFVKICPFCGNVMWQLDNPNDEQVSQYRYNYTQKRIVDYNNNICSECGKELIITEFSVDDYYEAVGYDITKPKKLRGVDNRTNFYNLNKELFKKYVLPLKQFDTETKEYEHIQQIVYGNHKPNPIVSTPPIQSNTPKCPACGSTNLRHISSFEKATNIAVFGLLGNKRKYQFECMNPRCKYKF